MFQKMSGLHEDNNSIIACNLLSRGLSKNCLMPFEASVFYKEFECFENKNNNILIRYYNKILL